MRVRWLTLGLLACGPASPAVCLGEAETCASSLPDLTLLATHNAMSNAEDGWFAPNQAVGIEAQLAAGVRGLLIDVYPGEAAGDPLRLCHGYCEAGSRDLADALGGIRDHLVTNSGEIVVLILEEHAPADDIAAAFVAADLDDLAMDADDVRDWPSVGDLVAADRRLLVTSEGSTFGRWYHDFWAIGQDTPYTFSGPEDLSCAPNRGGEGNPLFLVNHWFGRPFPSPELATDANGSLVDRVAACEAERGQRANLVAVDFFDLGPDPSAFGRRSSAE